MTDHHFLKSIGIRGFYKNNDPVIEWDARDLSKPLYIKFMSLGGESDEMQARQFEHWLVRHGLQPEKDFDRLSERAFHVRIESLKRIGIDPDRDWEKNNG